MKRLILLAACIIITSGCEVMPSPVIVSPDLPSATPTINAQNTVFTTTSVPTETTTPVPSANVIPVPLSLIPSTADSPEMFIGRNAVSDGKNLYYVKDNIIYRISIKTGKSTIYGKVPGTNNRMILDSNGDLYCLVAYPEEQRDFSEADRSLYSVRTKGNQLILDGIGDGDVVKVNKRYIYYCKVEIDDTLESWLAFYAFDRNRKTTEKIFVMDPYYDFYFGTDIILYVTNHVLRSYNYTTGKDEIILSDLGDRSWFTKEGNCISYQDKETATYFNIYDYEHKKVLNSSVPIIKYDITPIGLYGEYLYLFSNEDDTIIKFSINTREMLKTKINTKFQIEDIAPYQNSFIIFADSVISSDNLDFKAEIWRYTEGKVTLIKRIKKVTTYLGPVNSLEIHDNYVFGYDTACGDDSRGNSFGFVYKLPK